MAQFDVHRNSGKSQEDIPFVVIVQSALYNDYRRRVVVPLVRKSAVGRIASERFNPTFRLTATQNLILSDVQEADKAALEQVLRDLRDHAVQLRFRYTHCWQNGDLVIWDNRCSYHKAAGDYPPEQDRIHWRVSIKDWEQQAA